MNVSIHTRTDADIDRCVEMVKITRELDGYPPIALDDYRWMFDGVPELGAWVAEVGVVSRLFVSPGHWRRRGAISNGSSAWP